MKKKIKGSMTVEACIILPLFLCIIVSILFLIKLTYTHELIQHAISETAGELASAAYIYEASGLRGIHDTVKTGIDNKTGGFKENVDNILNVLKTLSGDNVLPLEQLETAADFIAGGAFNRAETELLTPLIRLVMEKYVAEGSKVSADERLKKLNVKDGMPGMDFSQSSFFKGEEEDIEIVVSYEIKLPVPVNILPELKIVQKAVAKAWMSGDEPPALEGSGPEEDDNVWSLGNLQRGAKIRAYFGANLPFSFPVIARFDNGKAVMIKSMDLTAESYKTAFNICKNLDAYINELSRYKGQETPWGKNKIVIKREDIKSKQLLLVIPRNKLLPVTEEILEKYGAIACSKGVELKIVRYGIKQDAEEG